MRRPDDSPNILCSSVVGRALLESFTMRIRVQIPVINFFFFFAYSKLEH